MRYSVYTLISLLFLSTVALGQTSPSDENYVLQTSYQKAYTQEQIEDSNFTIPNDHKIESIVYYDGLGRAKQNVAIRAGGSREDLVTPIVYDPLGRQPKEYLPLPLTDNYGAFNANTTVGGSPGVTQYLEDYYQAKFPEDLPQGLVPGVILNPYSEKRFENSPLNRVLEQAAPGDSWRLSALSDADHTIKFEYGTNTSNEVLRFYVTYNPNDNAPILHLETSNSGKYPAQALYRSVTKDENWKPGQSNVNNHTTEEFKDKLGRVILKRTFDNGRLDTYYIYDDYGNLVFVLSPEGSDKIVDGNVLAQNKDDVLEKFGYEYRYDYRNRLVWKKIPGKGYETILYNNLNRPVLTQDANMRNEDPNKYLFTKYDCLGRVAYTGFYTATIPKQAVESSLQDKTPASICESQRTSAQGSVQIGDKQVYYTNSSFPYNNLQVLTINYYDKYVDYTVAPNLSLTPPTNVLGVKTTEDVSVTTSTKGLPTVSWVRILNSSNPGMWITSVTTYDSRGRALQLDSYNQYLQTRDWNRSRLDLITSRVEEAHSAHHKDGQPSIVVNDYFTYDHMGRLLTQKQQIGGSPLQLIAENQYDELGQLVRKNVGGETEFDGYTQLTNVDATFDGILTKTGSADSWDSGGKTKGKIVGNGGISFTVLQDNMLLRAGLLKTSTTNDNWINGYDYGLYFTNTDNDSDGQMDVKAIVNGVEQPTTYEYGEGDFFSIERSGASMIFKRNDTPFLTLNNQFIAGGLVGKVSFKSPGVQIGSFGLFGGNIDKKLQHVDYTYNIRGWLTDINDINPTGSNSEIGSDVDLFNFRINYNKVEGNAVNAPLYNGNIAQTLWKTMNTDKSLRGYAYGYDPLNRIAKAESYKGTTLSAMALTTEYTLDNIQFDRNGNILTLNRSGANDSPIPSFGQWDELEYTYDGNRLMKVVDSPVSLPFMAFGFKDGTNQGDDYAYDDNGNMTMDLNKGVSAIDYNHLNLPEKIYFTSGQYDYIEYVYDATGVKLSKTVQQYSGGGLQLHKTEYAGNYIYADLETSGVVKLQFFSQPEGYVEPVAGTTESVIGFDTEEGGTTLSSYKYVYQYKDHLGNVRLSYSDNDLNGSINPATEIVEESNYYPFGLEHKGYNNVVNGTEHPYKFQGQELEEELGKNTYAFQWRDYDPAIGRFNKIDRFSEKYHPVSPYAFTANNPLKFMEMRGDSLKVANNDQSKEYLNSAANNRNQDFIKYDDDGNVSLDFGDLSEKQIARRLKNDSGLSVINDMVNSTDSEGNSENFYFEVSNNREGILDGNAFSITLSAQSGDVVTDYSWFDNFSTTARGDGLPTVTPANGMDGAVYISPGQVYNTNVSYDPLNIGGYVRHELRENYSRTHDKKPYKEAHESAGYPSSFTKFKFN